MAEPPASRSRLDLDQPGADFVVLPIDPVDGDVKALVDAKVTMTVVRGGDVYRAP